MADTSDGSVSNNTPLTLNKVVVSEDQFTDQASKLQSTYPDIEVVVTHSPEELDREIVEADGLIGFRASDELLDRAKHLRWAHALSAGVEHWTDLGLDRRGILLTNSSGVHATNIAEHVMAMMLAFARQLPLYIDRQRDHDWAPRSRPGPEVFELEGQTVAIIGTGAIGSAVALRAKAFGMRTIGARRHNDRPKPEHFDEQVAFDDLADRLGDADHVVIALPMTPETEGLFDARLIAAMRPGSYFYNIGRGGIVEQNALIDALNNGHLGGAGLDVTTPEPLPSDAPLWDARNVIITGHSSGSTPKYGERAFALIETIIGQLLAGETPTNRVDVDAGY